MGTVVIAPKKSSGGMRVRRRELAIKSPLAGVPLEFPYIMLEV